MLIRLILSICSGIKPISLIESEFDKKYIIKSDQQISMLQYNYEIWLKSYNFSPSGRGYKTSSNSDSSSWLVTPEHTLSINMRESDSDQSFITSGSHQPVHLYCSYLFTEKQLVFLTSYCRRGWNKRRPACPRPVHFQAGKSILVAISRLGKSKFLVKSDAKMTFRSIFLSFLIQSIISFFPRPKKVRGI